MVNSTNPELTMVRNELRTVGTSSCMPETRISCTWSADRCATGVQSWVPPLRSHTSPVFWENVEHLTSQTHRWQKLMHGVWLSMAHQLQIPYRMGKRLGERLQLSTHLHFLRSVHREGHGLLWTGQRVGYQEPMNCLGSPGLMVKNHGV